MRHVSTLDVPYPLRHLSFKDEFEVLGGAVAAGSWGEDLHQAPAVAGVVVDELLILLLGFPPGPEPALAEADESVFVFLSPG